MDTARYLNRIERAPLFQEIGRVVKSVGMVFEAYLPGASVGALCRIFPNGHVLKNKEKGFLAEVVGFRDRLALLMAYEEIKGASNESKVILERESCAMTVSEALLGRVLDANAIPLDDLGEILHPTRSEARELYRAPSHPLERQMIESPLDLGVRSLNGFLTTGTGQRVGIMAGSGVGKSVLLGMMSRHTAADVNVIALIGERGREVKEFIERDLGPEGLKRSVIIVATSEKSPLLRMRGAFVATTIAEYFRDQGKSVLLMVDSVTRFCMAQREIGLSMGEPPATKGYTPSVFSTLPKLLERAGMGSNGGSVTGLYTVLVEGDAMDDPIADSARSILDGHIVLSRRLAERGQFPAVDVLQSTSRVMNAVISPEHKMLAQKAREWMAIYGEAEDLINIGAYVKGANPKLDQSVAVHDRMVQYLKQGTEEKVSYAQALAELRAIYRAGELAAEPPRRAAPAAS